MDSIRQRGLKALKENLGTVGMIEFLKIYSLENQETKKQEKEGNKKEEVIV